MVDGAVALFAGWTLLANATVLTGGSLDQLIRRAAVALALAAGAGLFLARRGRRAASPPGLETDLEGGARSSDGEGPGWLLRARLAALATGAGLALAWLAGLPLLGLWASGLVLLAALAWVELRLARGPQQPDPVPRRHTAGLALLALVGVLASLAIHRPAADEAFYVNLAVGAVDAPGLPLLARDTLHGLERPYPAMSIYRVQSWELLAAALARLTGLEALVVAQLVLPALAALLVPLAAARLFRLLAPRRWLACTAVVVLAYLLLGDTPRGYGSFGFARLMMGKAVFRSVGVPLLAACAIELARAPAAARGRAWLRLALLQVAAIGLTSTALWIAPVVAALGLLAGLDLRRGALGRLAHGIAASVYPVLVGLWLRAELEGAAGALESVHRPAALFRSARADVLGDGPAAALQLAALLAAWGAAGTSVARRFTLLYPLALLAVFWNPYTAPFLAEHLTGNPTYWRVFWLVPLPSLVALLVTAPLERARRSWAARALTLALVSALFWMPERWVARDGDGAWLGRPAIEIPPDELAAARAVVQHTAPGERVLAPEDISLWIPTLHGHPYPLSVRDIYLLAQREQLGDREVARRTTLTLAASGEGGGKLARQLERGVADYGLSAVCLVPSAANAPRVATVLQAAGLAEVWRSEGYVLWARPLSRR